MEYLQKLLDAPEGEAYEWLRVLGYFFDLCHKPCVLEDDLHYEPVRALLDGEQELLTKACSFEGNVWLTPCGDGPHSRPPDFFIRRMAEHALEIRGISVSKPLLSDANDSYPE